MRSVLIALLVIGQMGCSIIKRPGKAPAPAPTICPSTSVNFNNNVSPPDTSKMIPLSFIDEYDQNVTIQGSALTGPYQIIFDTGSNILTLPQSQVDQSAITILESDVTDLWGNYGDVVQGQISILSADSSVTYTIDNFIFFQQRTGHPQVVTVMGFVPIYELTGSRNYCMGNFFLDLDYSQYVSPNAQLGYSLVSISDHQPQANYNNFALYVQVGLENLPQNMIWNQNANPISNCPDTGNGHRPYHVLDPTANAVPLISDVNFVLDPVNDPTTLVGQHPLMDTGTPPIVIHDDPFNTLTTKYQSILLPNCYEFIPCPCFPPGFPMDVVVNFNGLVGSYRNVAVSDDQFLLCPGGEGFGSGPNLGGRSFFYHINQQSYNIVDGTAGISFPFNPESSNPYYFGGNSEYYSVQFMMRIKS